MKSLYTIATAVGLSIGVTYLANGQDFIRIGASHDFQKQKIVQTFSFDFNRTEKIDEKKGRFLLFDHNNFYILPTSDINLGDGVTSSENNVLFQINSGKAFYGTIKNGADNLAKSVWNKAIEFNPSYNSDKLFDERLLYGQVKFLLNYVSQRHNGSIEPIYIKRVHSFAFGVFTNLGSRFSKTYDVSSSYSTVGVLMDYKTRLLNSSNEETWVFRFVGNFYRITSDIEQLTTDKYAGNLKGSIDRLMFKNTYIGLSYKYGTDNPNYKLVNVLELSAKFKY